MTGSSGMLLAGSSVNPMVRSPGPSLPDQLPEVTPFVIKSGGRPGSASQSPSLDRALSDPATTRSTCSSVRSGLSRSIVSNNAPTQSGASQTAARTVGNNGRPLPTFLGDPFSALG